MCRLKRNVSASGAEPFVSFEGFTEKLASFYRQSDVVVLPSLVPEAFGLSLCEAMYCQTAVISNTLGAQKEIVEHHQSGILLDRLTPESLADEIECLVLNPEAKTHWQRQLINASSTVLPSTIPPTNYWMQYKLLSDGICRLKAHHATNRQIIFIH